MPNRNRRRHQRPGGRRHNIRRGLNRPGRDGSQQPPQQNSFTQPPRQFSPLPWNSQFQSTVGGLYRDSKNTQADIAARRAGVQQEYGFDDYSDPYARARLLERSYQQGQQGHLNQYASRGQLYSGAYQRQRQNDIFDFGQQQNALRGEYEQQLYGLNREGLENENTLRQGILEAQQQRLEGALEERPDPSVAPPPAAQINNRRRGRNQGRGGGGRHQNRNRRRRRR